MQKGGFTRLARRMQHPVKLGGKLREPLPDGRFIVPFVTEIELLSYPDLTETDELVIRDFLGKIQIVGLTQEIKDRTISLRRGARLKTPDAFIAATAIIYDTCVLLMIRSFSALVSYAVRPFR